MVHNAAYNKFELGEVSWLESRIFTALAIKTLVSEQHPLSRDIIGRLDAMLPRHPLLTGLKPVSVGSATAPAAFSFGGIRISLNHHGGIETLRFLAQDNGNTPTKIALGSGPRRAPPRAFRAPELMDDETSVSEDRNWTQLLDLTYVSHLCFSKISGKNVSHTAEVFNSTARSSFV